MRCVWNVSCLLGERNANPIVGYVLALVPYDRRCPIFRVAISCWSCSMQPYCALCFCILIFVGNVPCIAMKWLKPFFLNLYLLAIQQNQVSSPDIPSTTKGISESRDVETCVLPPQEKKTPPPPQKKIETILIRSMHDTYIYLLYTFSSWF